MHKVTEGSILGSSTGILRVPCYTGTKIPGWHFLQNNQLANEKQADTQANQSIHRAQSDILVAS